MSSDRQIPFLKWAGGKRWFAERWLHLLPKKFNRYIEPFVGGGAVFFAIQPEHAILADLNEDLIITYRALRDAPGDVQKLLEGHHKEHSEEYYYNTRALKPSEGVEVAAWFIYLNRTCWNGLYRVNLKNQFNVPIGTKTQVILPTDNFSEMANRLRGVALLSVDFEKTIDLSAAGDLLFVDPPYTVKHNLNGFLKYNDRIFSWEDQVRLRDAVVRARERGVMVIVTNANHHSIRELYAEVGQHVVLSRASVLAANSKHRASVEELAIRTWVSSEGGARALR